VKLSRCIGSILEVFGIPSAGLFADSEGAAYKPIAATTKIPRHDYNGSACEQARIFFTGSKLPVPLTYPFINRLTVEAPVGTDPEGRQLPRLQQPINCRLMNPEVACQLAYGQNV
jgi:hypothetical protein